ncbi:MULTISPECIES: hypothetical protein [Asticcacaulis]|uniref:hypothetical protein n=1 Tax=Asticcacaulis TaxID=76890 RepID=UPI001FD99E61|nr:MULTISPECIES: hypothetical protein [Asticcacaulis]MBP2160061.1 hypothetical protein [Asticcacaulis solisilvae]MDR6801106.1 hypothetical protein [Asticcacaulis sp. BE141]
MATEIRPSLAQLLNTPQATPRPAAQAPAQQNSFTSVLQAQRAFFQQVTEPKITPATYTAADIARATPVSNPAPTSVDPNQPLRRPGSFLNIVV